MWLYGALPLAASQVQSAALGGSAVTCQQCNLLVDGKATRESTVALSGAASTVSAGSVGFIKAYRPDGVAFQAIAGNLGFTKDGAPGLVGESSTVSAGSVLAPRTFALSGTASTTGIGTVLPQNKPTTIVTTALVPATGTLVWVQNGDPVTVNLNAGDMEATFFTGTLGSSSALSGQAITSAAGTATVSNLPTDTLLGQSITSHLGIVGVQSDVEDTFIQSYHGVMAFEEAYALTGIGITVGQESMQPSGDQTYSITGEAITSAIGSFADFGNEFELVGQEILGELSDGDFGLPQFYELSGIEIVTAAGTVYLNDDRDYPLQGMEIAVQAGNAVTSSLAFLSNNLITTEQETIGPREVELEGSQIDMGQYQFVLGRDHGAGKPKKDKKRKKVTVDGQVFECDEDELKDLVRVCEEVATAKAKEEADALLAIAKAEKLDKIKLKVPKVTGSEELRDKLADIYAQAAIDAQVALEVSRNRQLDEEEAIVLLLVN